MANSKSIIPVPKRPKSSLPVRLAMGATVGLIAGATSGSTLAGILTGGAATVFLVWDSRSLIIEGQSAALRALEDDKSLTIDADSEGTHVTVRLHRSVPVLHAIERGRGTLTGDVEFDNAVRLQCDDAQWIGLLLSDVRATLIRLIATLTYDRKSHALVVSAYTSAGHAELESDVNQTKALANRLRALSRQSAVSRLRARMQEPPGEQRLTTFKAMWRADQRSSVLLARELSDPEIRYFIATSRTPPDRTIIKTVAFDAELLSDLRAEAMLRWLGLHADLGGEALTAAFDALRAGADHPHAQLLARALDTWIACAPHSGKALLLLGKHGSPQHLGIIGAQRQGSLADVAHSALRTLRARFEGMQSGHLALVEGGGQLAFSEEDTGPPALEAGGQIRPEGVIAEDR